MPTTVTDYCPRCGAELRQLTPDAQLSAQATAEVARQLRAAHRPSCTAVTR